MPFYLGIASHGPSVDTEFLRMSRSELNCVLNKSELTAAP